MKKNMIVVATILLSVYVNAQTPKTDNAKSKNEVVAASDVEWGWLNPLRGDKSPTAGKLWGDRTDTLASGSKNSSI